MSTLSWWFTKFADFGRVWGRVLLLGPKGLDLELVDAGSFASQK